MADITVFLEGRRRLVFPAFSVRIQDATGKITFRGFSQGEAAGLATMLKVVVADRPIAPLAEALALTMAAQGADIEVIE